MNKIKLNSISLNGNSLNSVGGVNSSKNKLKKNEFIAIYDVSTTTEATSLFGDRFSLSNFEQFYIDDNPVSPTHTYRFDSTGLHTIKAKLKENIDILYFLFYQCTNLVEVDVSKIDTSSVTRLGYTFGFCNNLRILKGVESWNTSNVYSFDNIFNSVPLKNINVTNFDTREATEMNGLFANCVNLESIDLSNFEVSKSNLFARFLYNCKKISHVDMSGFILTEYSNLTDAFFYCTQLENLNAPYNWASSNIVLSYSSKLSPLSIHLLIERSASVADGATARTLTLHATAKTNWMNSEYYEEDEITRISKGIEIA